MNCRPGQWVRLASRRRGYIRLKEFDAVAKGVFREHAPTAGQLLDVRVHDQAALHERLDQSREVIDHERRVRLPCRTELLFHAQVKLQPSALNLDPAVTP
jgi:hypothetical protein